VFSLIFVHVVVLLLYNLDADAHVRKSLSLAICGATLRTKHVHAAFLTCLF